MAHIPVLLREAIAGLNLKQGDNAIDCTLGDGGHTAALLEKVGEEGKVLSLDVDAENIKKAKIRFQDKKNLILAKENFVHLKELIQTFDFKDIKGILIDLGWSSEQFENSGRGFSFLRDEPLDMRLDLDAPLTAKEILNKWSEDELGRIFRSFGEERNWKKAARAIVDYRKKKKIETTFDLLFCLEIVLRRRHGKIHPATLVFQALRIAVNDELSVLQKTLPQTLDILAGGGRLAVISFHSLEDRLVKRFFQKEAKNNLIIITKKPIVPGQEELKANSRSRSAKLRLAQKI